MNGTIEIVDGILIVRIPVSPILKKSKLKITDEPRLTRREEEVLELLVQSKSNKEIANELYLAERTVKYHMSKLMEKFDARGRLEIVEKVLRGEHIRHAGPDIRGARDSDGKRRRYDRRAQDSKLLSFKAHASAG